ncbi:MAG: PrsW family glutamic-type intramembrane protease [Candidatus Peribacteraceae bacterium]|nr:PrsW family glutamic-type intramembrane protease [Candidatus Peribacteraceae bacterium]
MQIFLAAGVVVAVIVLVRVWTGAMNFHVVEEESLEAVERKQVYLPKFGAITVSVVIGGALIFLSLRYGKNTSLQSLTGSAAMARTLFVFVAISALGLFDQFRWHGLTDRYKYFYAFVLATLMSWILIAFKRAFFEADVAQDPFLMALGIVCLIIGWRFLFGPWSAQVKATVLGTFLFWIIYALLRSESRLDLLATGIAALVALVPVVLWCMLFLRYHRERLSIVILAFFAGMLSTVPILFYSELTKRSVELNFFFFKIVPLNFNSTSSQFVSQSVFRESTGVQSILLTTLVTYLLVGVIEEVSKFWVLKRSGRQFFRSIDDALQLAIIIAIGFAFAENLANPNYYVGFVKDYLLMPSSPDWASFLGGVIGRAVLTTMVHVLSTGILGYFFGLVLFAPQVLGERFQRGRGYSLILAVHRILSLSFDDISSHLRPEQVFATAQLALGLVGSIVVHGLFDFIVTIPEVLPGNPDTVGALLGSAPSSFLHGISLVLLASLLYILGGFWLLTFLFGRTEDAKERGVVLEKTLVVS